MAVTTALLIFGNTGCPAQDAYQSPYGVQFSVPEQQLYGFDEVPPRNDKHLESNVPHEQWYSRPVRKELGAWGPESRQYPAIADYNRLPLEVKRQRVLAVALKLVGLPYQHHHIPDWNPPADWPWKEVAYGRNSKGVDCSNFTSWCYNYGLGIKLTSAVERQAELTEVQGPGGDGAIEVEAILNNDGYEGLARRLQTGDLLYIRNKSDNISHVIMWVGAAGRSPDGTPLIIDCTGEGHTDCKGQDIPIGVNLRPFDKNSWYYKSFDHANRILHQ